MHSEQTQRVRYLKRFAPYLWEYRWRLFASLVFLIIARLLSLADPYIIKKIIDVLIENKEVVVGLSVPVLIVLFFTARLIGGMFEGLKDLVIVKAETGLKQRIGLEVFSHMLDLSIAFHSDRSTGSVARKITRGKQALDSILWLFTNNILPTLLELTIITIVFLVLFPPSFAIVLIGTALIYVAYTIYTTERRQQILLEMNKADDVAGGKVVDSLLNYETVKYFTNEEYEYRSYGTRLSEWATLAIKAGWSLISLNVGQGIILASGLTLLLYMAYQQYILGAATVGDFVLITGYLGRIAIPLSFLGFVYRRAKEGLAQLDEMISLLYETITVKDAPGATALQVQKGAINFRQVSFGYSKDRIVLKDITLLVQPYERVALVGYSGSGKSTITKLLARFYDPIAGTITIDDQDISRVTQQSLRSQIGVVAQDAILFNATIGENIVYGNINATRKEVERAAKQAHIHDFIVQELPEGYETVVGERGVKLSGGEKQRIAIARMLLKNPPILIFDEATASLDTKAEKEIQQSIQELAGEKRTTIVIAHRLSTIVDFDRIVVFDKGEIVEEGSHDELLKADGRYSELWKLQLQEGA